ncbi:MAG: hypothetical protein SPLM_10320 [Spiroplasma phoeniceum]|uniref:hypothetical protein n=1 Tax=Spiroplasma phoeniceum TaxID=47835 RepID=UPI003133D318
MNWTIFFAVLILVCLFARPAWWIFRIAMSILGCLTGFCKGISDVRKKKKLDKQMKGGDRYDVVGEHRDN